MLGRLAFLVARNLNSKMILLLILLLALQVWIVDVYEHVLEIHDLIESLNHFFNLIEEVVGVKECIAFL